MNITPFDALACPLDGKPLHKTAVLPGTVPMGTVSTSPARGHTHLLPVQNKRSRDPGDSKEMVASRCRFLNAGLLPADC